MSRHTTESSSASFDRVADGFDPDEVARPLSALSFWFAIVLPLLYLPLLAAGIHTAEGLLLFLGLLGSHVLALIGGQGHTDRAGRHSRLR